MQVDFALILACLVSMTIGILVSLFVIGFVWIAYNYGRVPKGLNLIGGLVQLGAIILGLASGLFIISVMNDYYQFRSSNALVLSMMISFAISLKLISRRILK